MDHQKVSSPLKLRKNLNKTKKAILTLAFFLVAVFSMAQTGIVKGTVIDEFESPLPGAIIEAISSETKLILTEDDGTFLIELNVGKHLIVASYTLLESDTLEILVEENKVHSVDFILKEEREYLQEVVVSAGKFEQSIEDLTVSMEILKPELLENRNTNSIETVLEQTPGLTILDNEPQIRGGSGFTFGVGSRVQIVVDGMPLLTGDAGRPEWGFIPVENIEQIEVIKGASSVLYGSSALSGVINIRTKFPRLKPQTKVTFNTGLYSAPEISNKWYDDLPYYSGVSFVHSRIVKNNLDVVIGGNIFRDHGYIGPPKVDDDVVDSITNYTNNQMWKTRARFNFNLRYRSKKIEGLNMGLNGNFMAAKTNFVLAWLNDSTEKFRAYPGAIALQDQLIFNIDPFINYFAPNGIKHSLKTRVFYTDNVITNNQSNSSTLWYSEYQLQRKFPKIEALTFTGGAVATLSKSKSEIYTGSGLPENRIVNLAGYSQIDKKVGKALNISAGFRMEYFKMNQVESVVKPVFRTGVNLKITEGTNFRYSYGQGFRFPTITERFISTNVGSFGVFPNANLQPETSANSEFGIKQGFKFGKLMGYLDIAGFHQEYQNTIEYLFGSWGDATTGTWPLFGFKFLNTGNTRVRGLDISLMGKMELKDDVELTFLGGYTYVIPVALNPHQVYAIDTNAGSIDFLSYVTTSMDTSNHLLKYRFKHTAKLNADLRVKKINVGFGVRYYSHISNIDTAFRALELLTSFPGFQTVTYTDYWKAHKFGVVIFDARFGVNINDKMKLSVVVNNVLNKEYSLRPMKIERPRTTAIQYVYKI
ncbi:MAG: outer membrane cobalamin receptor [Parvicellaceae bacterium]